MINTTVPGDCLELRSKVMTILMTPDEETGYMDGEVYQLLRPYVIENGLTLEQKLWLGVFYSVSYSCSTAVRFFTAFPSVATTTVPELWEFWRENKDTLYFNPDKFHLKRMDQVVPAIASVVEKAHGSMKTYLAPYMRQGHDAMYNELRTWRYYGPMGAYLFLDTVYGWSRELYDNLDPSNIDWNGGPTIIDAMSMLMGQDELVGTPVNSRPLDDYNAAVDDMVKSFHWTHNVIESNLCYLRKIYKGTRYLWYYADRDLKECYLTADILKDKCGVDIWRLRELTVPDEGRGEVHGWRGIRHELYKKFPTTGEL